MLKQLDQDGTVHLVLTKQEMIDTQSVMDAAMTSIELGLTRVFDPAIKVISDLVSAVYLLTDEEIVEGMVAIHRGHEGDDVEEMIRQMTESVRAGRASVESKGLSPA